MKAESLLQHGPSPANRPAEAVYFDSEDQRLFGWFHDSSPSSYAAVGVVLCKPFGYEAICAHRSIRAFAEALADAGFPALRFDYLGTGDSGEIDPQADQLQVWTRDALAAAQELRRRSGVTQICFLGVRLGALLATLAARQCRTESSLVLISPILSGRRYLRELRTIRMAALAGKAGADVAPNERDAGAMEVSGFTFSAATLASLKELDLTEPSISPASRFAHYRRRNDARGKSMGAIALRKFSARKIPFLARVSRDGDDRAPIRGYPPGDDRGDS